MSFSLRNKNLLFYAGFENGTPVLHSRRSPQTRFSSELCDAAQRQLKMLGYEFEKVPGEGHINADENTKSD